MLVSAKFKFNFMTKKIILILFSMVIILTGFLFLTPSGKTLPRHERAETTTPLINDFKKDSLSVKSGVETTALSSALRQANTSEKSPFAMEESTRSSRWKKAKSALSINAEIEQLLIESDVENPRFAYKLFLLCEQVNESKSSEQLPAEAVQQRLKEYANGRPHVTQITPYEWRLTHAIVDAGYSENTVAKKRALSDKFAARCGGPVSEALGIKVAGSIDNSAKAGSALANAPYGDLRSEASFAALEKVLRDPSLASVWLPIKRDFLGEIAENAGYFEGLNDNDKKALLWLVICNFGSDCADDGITRLDACLNAYLCDGNSVAESVANAVGKDKVPIVAARANKLSLDLAAAGAGFFKSRQK